jgi:hypothetical protein
MSKIADLVDATIERDPAAFAAALNVEMQSRALAAVEDYKKALASGMLFNPPEADSGVEAPETEETPDGEDE